MKQKMIQICLLLYILFVQVEQINCPFRKVKHCVISVDVFLLALVMKVNSHKTIIAKY